MPEKKELREEELNNVTGGTENQFANFEPKYVKCNGCGEMTPVSVAKKCVYCGSTDLEEQ